MRVMLLSLPMQQSIALTQLSVFPSTFDDEAAAAVMTVDEFRAHDVIKARVWGAVLLVAPSGSVWCWVTVLLVAPSECVWCWGAVLLVAPTEGV